MLIDEMKIEIQILFEMMMMNIYEKALVFLLDELI
jgi:hypothetical protein